MQIPTRSAREIFFSWSYQLGRSSWRGEKKWMTCDMTLSWTCLKDVWLVVELEFDLWYIYIYVNNSFLQQVYEPISVTFQKTVPKGWINLGNMHHKQIPNSILEGGLLEGGWGKECRRRPRICYINDLTGNYSLELTNFDLRTREL